MCACSIDWNALGTWVSAIGTWVSAIVSGIALWYLYKNYVVFIQGQEVEKEKRRLSLRPFFTLEYTETTSSMRHCLFLENVGEVAIVKKIINEAKPDDFVNVYKIGYAKGGTLKLETELIMVKVESNVLPSANYNHTIYFEDVEGRTYMQNVKFVNKKHYETVPIEVDVIP